MRGVCLAKALFAAERLVLAVIAAISLLKWPDPANVVLLAANSGLCCFTQAFAVHTGKMLDFASHRRSHRRYAFTQANCVAAIATVAACAAIIVAAIVAPAIGPTIVGPNIGATVAATSGPGTCLAAVAALIFIFGRFKNTIVALNVGLTLQLCESSTQK